MIPFKTNDVCRCSAVLRMMMMMMVMTKSSSSKKTSPTKAVRKKTVALTSTMALANWIGIVATSAFLKKLH